MDLSASYGHPGSGPECHWTAQCPRVLLQLREFESSQRILREKNVSQDEPLLCNNLSFKLKSTTTNDHLASDLKDCTFSNRNRRWKRRHRYDLILRHDSAIVVIGRSESALTES